MKGFYNAARMCAKHPGHVAAVCPECYDRALEQQERQVRREREAAHAAWLRTQGRTG